VADLSTKQIPVEEGLFTWPSDSPQLIASRCTGCSEVTFPKQASCPNCGSTDVEEILLSRRGRVWTWTIQNFAPPTPPYIGPGGIGPGGIGPNDRDSFVPYGVAYVELPEGVRVEARLTENDPEKLEIGMEMELVIQKFIEDADGNELMTFAFQPVQS
jgi:uncharacterized OB-fold protein